ncbi:MAG: glucose 1-dehydrogenase [Chloroflexota bacterium]
MRRLEGKVAIVVGGGQTTGQMIGNGRATAVTFAREGASVLVVDINGDSAAETSDMLAAEGGTASSFQADITEASDCAAMAAAAIERYGRIDILHNNVGSHLGDNHIHLLDEADWDRIYTLNVKGIFLCCRAVLPIMYKQGSGVVINVSSTAAVWSGDPFAAYNSSKTAVNGLTTSMVVDCARHGVRVNAIMPGSLNTPMGIDAMVRAKGIEREKLVAARDRAIPLGQKMGTAWDVANAALFLASDEAQFITGAILPVDGGEMYVRGD